MKKLFIGSIMSLAFLLFQTNANAGPGKIVKGIVKAPVKVVEYTAEGVGEVVQNTGKATGEVVEHTLKVPYYVGKGAVKVVKAPF
jgi:hypothetical protein